MKLVAPLFEEIATHSYDLFQVIMQGQVHQDCSEAMWEASRLALHGTFTHNEVSPPVGNPLHILNFLNHHFDSATLSGGDQDEPIQTALLALASVSGPAMTQALNNFDPTQPSFVNGIRHAFRAPQLRKAALLFLPLVADRWFNNPARLMGFDEMTTLCQDWASAVDDTGTADDVRKPTLMVFFGMVNSARWRPHIVAQKWALLKDFFSNPEDSEPLRRCLRNPELIDAIPNVGRPSARVLWLLILWSKHVCLTPDVKEKLRAATKDVSDSDRDVFLSAVKVELEKVDDEMVLHGSWSKEAAAVALSDRKTGLMLAKKAFNSKQV
jgi:hypothetical protein